MSGVQIVAAGAVLGLVAGFAAAQAMPEVDYEVVDDISYSQAQARKLWLPMTGSGGVSVVQVGKRRALKMPCTFRGTDIERASWDRDIRLDLAARSGVAFLVRCRDPRPVGHFSFYLRSGNGWYAASFSPAGGEKWKVVRIRKRTMRVEGKPAGWARVDRVRISAWRGRDEDTEFHIAALGLLGSPAEAKIAIIQAEAGTVAAEARAVNQCVERVSRLLDRLGQGHLILSDRDVTPERLAGRSLVILPYNPVTSDRVVDVLVRFLDRGGAVLAFYVLPRKLQEAAGLRVGRHVRQDAPGHFACIRASKQPLPGMPAVVKQASWNVHETSCVAGKGHVAAWWHNDKGESTGQAAIVVGRRCVFMTHILLGDDPEKKERLLLSMIGFLVPELWERSVASRLRAVGRFGPYEGFDQAVKDLRKRAADNAEAKALLARVESLRGEAERLRKTAKFPEAMAAAVAAQKAITEVYCRVQQPQAGEHRAFWCHSAFGVPGMTWDEAIKNLADNGFTAILPNMLWGGVAFYQSDVLPVAASVKEKGDQIALCAAACKKHGVACHVWKVNYNIGWRAPKAFVARMRAEGRLQVGADGKPLARRPWLCPSHPANQKLEIDSMVEVARKYDVAGVHFDYIRYPHSGACYCDGCRKRFEASIGRKIAHWPDDLRADKQLRRKWLDFRRRQITTVVAAVAERARKVKPQIKISAAVFRNWPVDRDHVGQDWKLWCDNGYLDFVCPMDYTPDSTSFERMVAEQLRWAGRVPCYPGIGASVWPEPTDVVKLIEQIRITRRLKTGGFTIFNYDTILAGEVVPLAGKGITRKK